MIRALILVATFSLFASAACAQDAGDDDKSEVESLKTDVERLKSIVPGQAVAMTQVAYNFGNLWFAAHAENWPLAQFYFNETRTRLRWAMRITPVRRISTGELALEPLLKALESNQLATLERAVADHDLKRFESAYTDVMGTCHGCHAASEKPYLRLRVPERPPEPLIDFQPQ